MSPPEGETWQVAANKCFLGPVWEASVFSWAKQSAIKQPPCVDGGRWLLTPLIPPPPLQRLGNCSQHSRPGYLQTSPSRTPLGSQPPQGKLPCLLTLSRPACSSSHTHGEESITIFSRLHIFTSIFVKLCFSSFAGCCRWKQQQHFPWKVITSCTNIELPF